LGVIDNQVCGSSFSPGFCSALQLQVPASLLTNEGTYTVEVTNPGGGVADTNFVVASSCTYSVDGSAFAGPAGGGFDLELHHHFAIKLVQADYLVTTFSNGSTNHQNDLRLSAELAFSLHR
jgi:hypothetical protein